MGKAGEQKAEEGSDYPVFFIKARESLIEILQPALEFK